MNRPVSGNQPSVTLPEPISAPPHDILRSRRPVKGYSGRVHDFPCIPGVRDVEEVGGGILRIDQRGMSSTATLSGRPADCQGTPKRITVTLEVPDDFESFNALERFVQQAGQQVKRDLCGRLGSEAALDGSSSRPSSASNRRRASNASRSTTAPSPTSNGAAMGSGRRSPTAWPTCRYTSRRTSAPSFGRGTDRRATPMGAVTVPRRDRPTELVMSRHRRRLASALRLRGLPTADADG